MYCGAGHRWQYGACALHAGSEYVTFITLPLQQWLHERSSMLRYTYIDCIVVNSPGFRLPIVEGSRWILFLNSSMVWGIFLHTLSFKAQTTLALYSPNLHSSYFFVKTFQNTSWWFKRFSWSISKSSTNNVWPFSCYRISFLCGFVLLLSCCFHLVG